MRKVDGGCEVCIWVVPGGSRDEITGTHGDRIRVRVTAPAAGGRANNAVCDLLSAAMGNPVSLLRGAKSRSEVVYAGNATPEAIRRNLRFGWPVA